MKKTFIFLTILAALSSCGSSNHLADYQKYAKSVEYDARIKSNTAFSNQKGKAKKSLKGAQKEDKELQKAAEAKAELQEIYAEIAKIKQQN